ncbi:unnamed protein product [Effrenium voratum]|nr:unnamed protein product [Effrenium voratum]CAJ1431902.1 unnamed protein product [Effrenium voratum]|eukprot:CAMPEP_0181435326 /NCGR_PEP_ID=MMETSP1110-20121109/20274_1 /TAXON_ID=174948 /ORGANISM="Symbiodinium sp., Strain CCMP421" /LENGTH=483 /DNA_ID=CAMNT_0023558855 /DNA_START=68 /DNA_END=1519 /DNA_ORIENTATION=+
MSLRVGIITKGTRGDVQPLLALAMELRQRGHHVAICCPKCVVPLVEERDIEAFGMSFDPKSAIQSDGMQAAIAAGDGALCITAFNSSQRQQMLASGVNPAEEVYDFVRSFHADALVGHPSFVPLIAVAEAFSLPLVNTLFMPFLPSAFAHPAFFTRAFLEDLGLWEHPLQAHKQLWESYITQEEFQQLNLLRARWGLRQHKDVAETQAVYQCAHEANCWSPHLLPEPADLRVAFPFARQTGCLFADSPDYQASPELLAFLAHPSKPLYVGFGSLCVGDPREATEKVLRALVAANLRCVMVGGWAGLSPSQLDPEKTKDFGALKEYASNHVFALEACPHDWLLPRCSGAVHHGGAGTVAAAARAGIPQTILAVAWDQPWWAEHLEQLQLGINLPMIASVDEDLLARAFRRLTEEPGLGQAAAELGKLMQEERAGHESLADLVLESVNLPHPWPTKMHPTPMEVLPALWDRGQVQNSRCAPLGGA